MRTKYYASNKPADRTMKWPQELFKERSLNEGRMDFLAACLQAQPRTCSSSFETMTSAQYWRKTAFNLRNISLLGSFGVSNTNHQQHPALGFTQTLEFTQTAMHKVLQTEPPGHSPGHLTASSKQFCIFGTH